MAHYGRLGNYITEDSAHDIRGRALYGWNDEKLGSITDAILDHSSVNIAYLVVNTGRWLRTREFLVPAERLRPSHTHEGDFACDLTMLQVKSFPPYEQGHLSSLDKWADYERRYRSAWELLPVIYRRESGGGGRATGEGEPAGLTRLEKSGLALGKSWTTFQALLHDRRAELIAQCGLCKNSAT